MRKSIMVLVLGMALGAPVVAQANFGGDFGSSDGFTSINPAVGVIMSGGEGIIAENQLRGACRGIRKGITRAAQGTPQWLRKADESTVTAPAAGRLRKLAMARASAR